jgi:hypothetical protein
MARPLHYVELTIARFEGGTFALMDAVFGDSEDRASFVRAGDRTSAAGYRTSSGKAPRSRAEPLENDLSLLNGSRQ